MRIFCFLLVVVLCVFWLTILWGTASLYQVQQELQPIREMHKRPICDVNGHREFCKRGES